MNYECEPHNSGSRAALNAVHAVAAAPPAAGNVRTAALRSLRPRTACDRAMPPTLSLPSSTVATNKERRSRANSSRSASCIIVIDGWAGVNDTRRRVIAVIIQLELSSKRSWTVMNHYEYYDARSNLMLI